MSELRLPPAPKRHLLSIADLERADVERILDTAGSLAAALDREMKKLPMAAVDEHRELHPRRPPELQQRVDRGADRTSRVQDVVDENDGEAFDRERDARRAHDRLTTRRTAAVPDVDVVTVERDVEHAHGQPDAAPLLDEPAEPRLLATRLVVRESS